MNKTQLLSSLKQKGFSKEILKAFEKVPRENFIPETLKDRAYEDTALPIGEGQTISQPYTIAMMLEFLDLKKGQKVLEIGSGCGYVLALISEIIHSEVYGIEIIKELADKSREKLRGYENIKVINKNGQDGLREFAPFDRIIISAALKKVPDEILSQLSEDAILVAPVDANDTSQSLIKLKRERNKFIMLEKIPGFIFVRFV